jgi:hypothetical protein
MKKYLFGLGAMLVGAGLMFVFTHTEVRAESEANIPEPFVCSTITYFKWGVETTNNPEGKRRASIINCKTKHLDCGFAFNQGNVSCVKRGGLFK